MKKLSPRYRKWLLYRQRKSSKSKKRRRIRFYEKVLAWSDGEVNEVISTQPSTKAPILFSLSQNSDEVLQCLKEISDGFLHTLKTQKAKTKPVFISESSTSKRLGKMKGYIDFSPIEYIGTSATVVLAAEYDRVSTFIQQMPPAINVHKWDEPVLAKLIEIGFFDILGITKEQPYEFYTQGNVQTMQLVSGMNAAQLEEVGERIEELCKFIDDGYSLASDLQEYLNGSIGEAIINVADHAYPENHDFRFPPVKKWWVTATADKLNRTLTVVVFDQGASIPITFPKKPMSKALASFLLNLINSAPEFEYQNDVHYIESAMKYGNTSTEKGGRGTGLPQMKDMIDQAGGGSLTIISRGGKCVYKKDEKLEKVTNPYSIGGTLVEWVLKL